MTSVITPTTANILSLSHQQMLLVSQQINLSLNVTGNISDAAASLCAHWFFSYLLTLKGIKAQALLDP